MVPWQGGQGRRQGGLTSPSLLAGLQLTPLRTTLTFLCCVFLFLGHCFDSSSRPGLYILLCKKDFVFIDCCLRTFHFSLQLLQSENESSSLVSYCILKSIRPFPNQPQLVMAGGSE